MSVEDDIYVGKAVYRCAKLFDMEWGALDLSEYDVVGAPFGGPIAYAWRRGVVHDVSASPGVPRIRMCNGAGRPFGSVPIDWSVEYVKFGWSNAEELVVVFADGCVHFYDVWGELLRQFQFDPMEFASPVCDCVFWSGGVVVMTTNMKLYSYVYGEGENIELATDGIVEPPTALAVIEPQLTLDQHIRVLVASRETIFVCSETACVDKRLTNGPFTRIAVSPDGLFVALYFKFSFCVYQQEFKANLSQFRTERMSPPDQFVWCGNESVILTWGSGLIIVSPAADSKLPFTAGMHVVPEMDGVRILSNDRHHFLGTVPRVVQELDDLMLSDQSPSATLLEAYKCFKKGDPQSDEDIRSLQSTNSLPEAVERLLQAAANRYAPADQQELLRAASYGKSFIGVRCAEEFVSMCKVLRVLNHLRAPDVGMPLTYTQFTKLTDFVVIARLVSRRHFLLAIKICELNNYTRDKSRAIVSWACTKVRSIGKMKPQDRPPVEHVLRVIVERFEAVPGVSFAEVAAVANDSKQRELAVALLGYEPRASDQIDLLLKLGETTRALNCAVESGNADAVHMVLSAMAAGKRDEVVMQVARRPVAAALYMQQILHLRGADYKMVSETLHEFGRHEEALLHVLRHAYAMGEPKLNHAIDALAEFYQTSLKDSVAAKMSLEHNKLLAKQASLVSKVGDIMGRSLHDTVFLLATRGQLDAAKSLASDFHVTDKEFWWIRLRAIRATRDWAGLEMLANEKKSPVGYEPFAEVCIAEGKPQIASNYIARVTNNKNKAELYLAIKDFARAVQLGEQLKDLEFLHDCVVAGKGDSAAVELAQAAIAKLSRS